MVKAIISSVTRLENEPHVDLTLAMGVCRPARMDEVVEKGTEIGISSFLFYYSEKSYARFGDEKSTRNKTARLVRVARAAAKQSKRTLIPEIREFILFAELLPLARDYHLALIAENKPESKSVEETILPSPDIGKLLLMVGPESGLTDDEFDMAVSAGFKPVSLGGRRLRAETAGIIFPALVLNRLGDL
jgi:16S rRNA (uracil1498-N3)-methyltransferase